VRDQRYLKEKISRRSIDEKISSGGTTPSCSSGAVRYNGNLSP
jgi:hypothetical protein